MLQSHTDGHRTLSYRGPDVAPVHITVKGSELPIGMVSSNVQLRRHARNLTDKGKLTIS